MKYPKLWDGPSPIGEALVRALQRTGSPFLSAEAGDVRAGTMGKFSEVTQGVDAGFLSIGYRGSAPPYRVAGSGHVRHPFVAKGRLDRASAQGNPALAYVGAGKSVTLVSGTAPHPLLSRTVRELLTTRTGASFTTVLSESENLFQIESVVPGAINLSETGPSWSYGVSGKRLVGAELRPVYARWVPEDKAFVIHELPITQNTPALAIMRDLTPMRICRVGALKLLALVPVEPSIDVVGDPSHFHLSRLALSEDNGVSWSLLPPGDVTDAMVPTDGATGAAFANELRAFAAGLTIVPLVDGSWALTAVTRLYAAGGTIAERAYELLVFHITEAGSALLWQSPTTAVPETVAFLLADQLMIQIYFTGDTGTLVRFSPDLSTADTVDIPWLPANHGAMQPLSPTELVIPAFADGKYSLFVSGDKGATWGAAGTIDSKAPSPSLSDPVLQRYTMLAITRRAGALPAHTFPGAPWVGDGRKTPPWEA